MKYPYYRLFSYLLIVYIALILYASLYPISSFNYNGLSPFAFWFDKTSPYLNRFDIWINVLGYIPLGTLLVWRFYQKMEHIWAIILAILIAALLSFFTESLQTYLTNRIASKLDWYTNTLGAFMGACIGIMFSPILVREWPIIKSYRRNFSNKYPFGLFLMVLWIFSALAPQPYWFSLGFWQSGSELSSAEHVGVLEQIYIWILAGLQLQYLVYFKNFLPDILLNLYDDVWPWVMLFSLSGMALATTLHAHLEHAKKYWFVLPLLILFAVRTIFFTLEHQSLSIPKEVWHALFSSLIIVYLSAFLSLPVRAILALIMLFLAFALSNLLPINSYYHQSLKLWNASVYVHIFGLFKWIYICLPFLAIGWAFHLLFKYLYFQYQQKRAFKIKYYTKKK